MILIIKTFLASALAFAITYPVARASVNLTGVPSDFPPFTALPILSGVVVGPLMATAVYAALRPVSADITQVDRLFFFVTLASLILSLALPLRLSFTQSQRFAGVTPSAQMILVLLHVIVAVCTFLALTYKQKI